MGVFISQHKSIAELYAELCIRFSELQRGEASETATCSWCGKRRLEHRPDGLCGSNVTSQYFTVVRSKEFIAVEKALGLIEELKAL